MEQETRQHVNLENIDDVIVARFADEKIDFEDLIRRIGDQLYELVESREGVKLLLDFSGVRFMSSSMIGKLINLKKKSVVAHGQVKLCSLTPYMRTVFEISRLDRVFDIYSDEQAALDAF